MNDVYRGCSYFFFFVQILLKDVGIIASKTVIGKEWLFLSFCLVLLKHLVYCMSGETLKHFHQEGLLSIVFVFSN